MGFNFPFPKDEKKKKRLYQIAALATAFLFIASAIAFYPSPKERPELYQPVKDLPQNFLIVVDEPQSVDDMAFIAALSSIAVRDQGDTYNPMFITDGGQLDQHVLWTLEHMEGGNKTIVLFSNEETMADSIRAQGLDVLDEHVFPKDNKVLCQFTGFDGAISVGSLEEALWVAPLASQKNMVIGIDEPTYTSQEEVWMELKGLGVPPEYLVVANPKDFSVETLSKQQDDYDPYDNLFHVPALSCLAAELAAFRNAYVLTDCPTSTQQVGNLNDEYLALNSRAIGTYLAIRNFSSTYQIPEYICIVGSAAAVPQFQMPGNGDGDTLVSSDVMFGFLNTGLEEMDVDQDSAVARMINLNLPGMANQLVRTFAYDRITQYVNVEYSDIAGGPQDVDWRLHGASFSGYEITYERMQATPARWICKDYTDEGMEYEYYGPSGTGTMFGDGIKNTNEQDVGIICEASGMVAYRGHGSDTGALYGVRVYGPNGDEFYLSGERAATLDIPPQVSFFVSCMNAKIHGTDYGEDAGDVDLGRLFSLNYLYGGSVVLGGATEVSYSNIGQDFPALWAEYGLGIVRTNDDHRWDLNDAWFAFFWDGILDTDDPDTQYGSAGKALMWAENRYIANHDYLISPFWHDDSDELGAHWKEVTMFAIYGDPAFVPHQERPGENDYNPWKNKGE